MHVAVITRLICARAQGGAAVVCTCTGEAAVVCMYVHIVLCVREQGGAAVVDMHYLLQR